MTVLGRCFAVLAGFWAGCCVAVAQEVDLALALAIDVSYSVDEREHRLQMRGVANALTSPGVLEAIRLGPKRRIAISVYQWASDNGQVVVVPWTIVDGEASAGEVSSLLFDAERMLKGGTAISSALMFGASLFEQAPAAARRVIDLSTDGINNMGAPVKPASKRVVAQGITVNGLSIETDYTGLDRYLNGNLTGGPAAFVEDAPDYDGFGAAMLRKLVREITGPRTT